MRLPLILIASCALGACADEPPVREQDRIRHEASVARPAIPNEYHMPRVFADAVRTSVRGNLVVPPGDFPRTTEATVFLTLSEQGDIQDIKLIKSSGYKKVDQAIVKALMRSAPLPILNLGNSTEKVTQLHLVFRPFELDAQQGVSADRPEADVR